MEKRMEELSMGVEKERSGIRLYQSWPDREFSMEIIVSVDQIDALIGWLQEAKREIKNEEE